MNTALIIARIFINPAVNVFQKRLTGNGVSPLHLVLFTYTACAVISFPVIILNRGTALPASFYKTIIIMSVFGTAGNALLMLALRHSDLSIFGPINAFKPVIGLIFAFFMIGETPSMQGLAGAAVIVGGSAFLSHTPGEGFSARSYGTFLRSKGVLLRIGSLTLISVEAVLMKKAVVIAGPVLSFSYWAAAGAPLLLILCAILKPGAIMKNIRLCAASPFHLSASIILYALMQFITFIIFTGIIVGYSLAMFQMSAVINVILGHTLFREKGLIPRLAGCIVMTAGAVLIMTG